MDDEDSLVPGSPPPAGSEASGHPQKPEEPWSVPFLGTPPNSETKAEPTEGVTSIRVRGGQEARVHNVAYLLLSVLLQEGHEAQCPAPVPLPKGHLRDHPEDSASMPGLPPSQVPGERHEERE